MLPQITSVYAPLNHDRSREHIEKLFGGRRFTLEHIVSNGHATKAGEWYDQPDSEWVVLIQGTAQLKFEQEGILNLKTGDACLIPAHQRHRVEACSGDAIWLALHFQN
jgi:cupin 2 domain-containing protein